MKAINIKLGDSIRFYSFLEREKAESGPEWGRKKTATWELRGCDATNGIIIGVRYLQNGVSEWDSEGGWMFTPKRRFKALLVITSLHRKPVFIPFPSV